MQQLLVLYLSFLFNGYSPMPADVKFEHGLSWDQIKQKARAEDKYIFIDCFTTWCAPCKKMDLEVYTNSAVADQLNENFISVKVQLDSTAADNAEVQAWYAEAHEMMSRYKVGSFPTFLFLSPDGKLVHKAAGFHDEKRFLELLENALDPKLQVYTLLEAFHNRSLAPSGMPDLTRQLERIQEKKAAREVAELYIDDHLLKEKDEELYTSKNIRFIASHMEHSDERAFSWCRQNPKKIDSVMGSRFSERITDHIISQEEVIPVLTRWDSLKIATIGREDWAIPYTEIRDKFGVESAERNILNGQIRWYTYKHQWKEVIEYNIKKIDNYGLDTAGEVNLSRTNNMIYNVLFQYSTEEKQLNKAIQWMKMICEAHPKEPDYLDTYANLLYKAGHKNNALIVEEIAVANNSRNDKEIIANLEKMKKGQPTWNLTGSDNNTKMAN